jgi:hypothetical protein
MLAYILWGDRLDEFKSEVNRATDRFTGAWSRSGSCSRSNRHYSARTGNVAFDDWRDAEITRLEEERRKLDEMRSEFEAHLRELRRAKDQSEFDEFMKAWEAGRAAREAVDDAEDNTDTLSKGGAPRINPRKSR